MKPVTTQRPGGRAALRLAIVLLLLAPLLVACEDTAMLELVAEMAIEWAQEKGLLTADLNPNYPQILAYEGQKWWDGTTGDSQLDAALDAGKVVKNINDADNLAQEGLESGDTDKIEQAIELRPDDWSYRDKRAAVLTAQGDIQGAQDSFAEAEWLVDQRVQSGGSCVGLTRNLLENRQTALQQQIAQHPGNADLRTMLNETQSRLAALGTGVGDDPCP